jgi:hypothetical protein
VLSLFIEYSKLSREIDEFPELAYMGRVSCISIFLLSTDTFTEERSNLVLYIFLAAFMLGSTHSLVLERIILSRIVSFKPYSLTA